MNPLEQRLEELESRYTVIERSYQELSDVLAEQWRVIEKQSAEIARLKVELESGWQQRQSEPPPPHY